VNSLFGPPSPIYWIEYLFIYCAVPYTTEILNKFLIIKPIRWTNWFYYRNLSWCTVTWTSN